MPAFWEKQTQNSVISPVSVTDRSWVVCLMQRCYCWSAVITVLRQKLQPHDAALARIDGLQCRSRGLIQAAANGLINCFCLRIPWSSWFIIHLVLLHPAVEAASVIYSKWARPQRESCPKHIMVSCFHPTALAHPRVYKAEEEKFTQKRFVCFVFF